MDQKSSCWCWMVWGDIAVNPDGKTALETSPTHPTWTGCQEGTLGQTIPIRYGITPGSGPAHLALFGYEPLEYVIGRGAFSAAGINLPVKVGDIAARGNLCTLDGKGNVMTVGLEGSPKKMLPQ